MKRLARGRERERDRESASRGKRMEERGDEGVGMAVGQNVPGN